MKSALHLAPQRSLAGRYLAGFGAVVAPLSLLGQTALGLAIRGPTRPAAFSTRSLRGSWLTPRASVLPPWAALALRMHGFQSRQHRQPGDPVSAGEPVRLQQ